jgi:hypothetical protein
VNRPVARILVVGTIGKGRLGVSVVSILNSLMHVLFASSEVYGQPSCQSSENES